METDCGINFCRKKQYNLEGKKLAKRFLGILGSQWK
jgi:hypothetical protein